MAREPNLALLGLLCAATSLGFLLHNWPPARIFMGDVGSTFLGFTFAAAPLLSAPDHRPELATFSVVAVLPFVTDATLTLLRRLLRGDAVWQAHREHLYQRLVRGGWSHRRTTLCYAAAATVSALAGLAWLRTTL